MTEQSRARRPAAPMPTPDQLDTLNRTSLGELTVDDIQPVVDWVLNEQQREDVVPVARFGSAI